MSIASTEAMEHLMSLGFDRGMATAIEQADDLLHPDPTQSGSAR
jgi:hypothetical protein